MFIHSLEGVSFEVAYKAVVFELLERAMKD